MYGQLGSTTELNKLIIFIGSEQFKKILAPLVDEMAKKLERYAKTMIHVPDTSVVTTISYNDFFPSMCDTKITSYTVPLLTDVAFCSFEELNVLSFFVQRFVSMSVCQICHGRTYCGTVNWLW